MIYLIPAAGVLALLFAMFKASWVKGQDAGDQKMQTIAGHIQEGAMAFLYAQVPAAGTSQVSGVIVALTYRLITILVAMIGVVYYWTSRKEVQEAMEEAEQE